jgi:hypothetical protein
MADSASKTTLDETKMCALLLRKRLVAEGQLKAALDYQRSVGGDLLEVLIKLNLVREKNVDDLLAKLEGGEEAPAPAVAACDVAALSPEAVCVSDLKVHRKLLEKLPSELVEKYLLVLFFPAAGLNLRKIILGHGCDIPPEIPEKIKSRLGVDICSLCLDPGTAISILKECGYSKLPEAPQPVDQASQSAKAAAGAAPPEAVAVPHKTQEVASASTTPRKIQDNAAKEREEKPREKPKEKPKEEGQEEPPDPIQGMRRGESAAILESVSGEALLRALASVLIKKGIVTPEELEVEIELARIRQRSGAVFSAQ